MSSSITVTPDDLKTIVRPLLESQVSVNDVVVEESHIRMSVRKAIFSADILISGAHMADKRKLDLHIIGTGWGGTALNMIKWVIDMLLRSWLDCGCFGPDKSNPHHYILDLDKIPSEHIPEPWRKVVRDLQIVNAAIPAPDGAAVLVEFTLNKGE